MKFASHTLLLTFLASGCSQPGDERNDPPSTSSADETSSDPESTDSGDSSSSTSPSSGGDDSGNAEPSTSNGMDSSGPESTGEHCADYLECLLAVCPDCYAGALALYGDEAACWDTPEQAAGCEQACEDLLADMNDQCECTGSQCTTCTATLGHTYQVDGADGAPMWHCNDGEQIDAGRWYLEFEYLEGRSVTARFYPGFGYLSDVLTGEHPCAGGSFTMSAALQDANGYAEQWSATVMPSDDALSLTATIVVSFTYTTGSTRVCTLSGNLTDR